MLLHQQIIKHLTHRESCINLRGTNTLSLLSSGKCVASCKIQRMMKSKKPKFTFTIYFCLLIVVTQGVMNYLILSTSYLILITSIIIIINLFSYVFY